MSKKKPKEAIRTFTKPFTHPHPCAPGEETRPLRNGPVPPPTENLGGDGDPPPPPGP